LWSRGSRFGCYRCGGSGGFGHRLSRGGSRRGTGLTHACQHGTHLDGLVFADENLLNHTRDGRGNFGVDFVGGDFHDRFVDGHGVSDGF
jgi:hypothetical protein